jgi:hypothetical protein
MRFCFGCYKQVLYNYLNVPFLGLKRAVLERQLQQVETELTVSCATLYTISILHKVAATAACCKASVQLASASNRNLYFILLHEARGMRSRACNDHRHLSLLLHCANL